MANPQEFINTYSDDLAYLMDFRDSHLTHPGKKAIPFLLNASLARIFSALMIGSIEAMIEFWKERDADTILSAYFTSGSNEERINSLIQNFKSNGIEVDENILQKYLAIKYLRNSIIHSGWNENQKEFIEAMGFPTDAQNLTEDHLESMYEVNLEMMKYIAATEHKEFAGLKVKSKLPSVKRYFTRKQLAGYLWNNLERIDYALIMGEEINDSLAEEAIYDWNLYKSITVNNVTDFDKVEENIQILAPLVKDKQYPDVPIGYINLQAFESSPSEGKSELTTSLEKAFKLKSGELLPFLRALNQGKACYDTIINITASSLLKKLAVVKDSVLETDLKNESIIAEKLFRLSRLYYDYAEKR